MKHLFIINPIAGKGKTLKYIDIIKEFFENEDDYIIEITKCPGHATRIVKEYVLKEDYNVYCIGGDGTLNEVLNGIVGSNSTLGIIPCGTGNDFVKTVYNMKNFKFDDNNFCKDFFNKIINSETKNVDLGYVNERYFINISSIGLDAEVNHTVSRLKSKTYMLGTFAYILGIFITLKNFKNKNVKIILDDLEINDEVTLCAVANGRYYGGGFKITPNASLNDGYFDICIARKVSKLKVIRVFAKLFDGSHGSIKEISFYRCKNVKIVSKDNFILNIDGENEFAKEANFKIIPSGVKLKVFELGGK